MLHLPEATNWRELWQANLRLHSQPGKFQHNNLVELRGSGRRQIVQAAIDFTRRYRNVDLTFDERATVLMSGHQPSLFHPGVWYKNFVLSQIGVSTGAHAINLIVDNDVCNAPTAIYPSAVGDSDRFVFGRLNYDENTNVLPFEHRSIENEQVLATFGQVGSQLISQFTGRPILKRLWPHVLSFADEGNLGLAISRGRHTLEEELGLATLELPISQLSQTTAFTKLAREILSRIEEFTGIYNDVAQQYRRLNKIRSNARPVPDLKRNDQWLETPFWIWSQSSPYRRSLFAKIDKQQLVLSDQAGSEFQVDLDCSDEEFHAALVSERRIRPKALMTTLFARLICCDLFIHGIGGAKYDQLTDEICQRFFQIRLPDYLTVSGTFLIQQNVDPISKGDIGKLRDELRQLRFHPEQFIQSTNGSAEPIQQQKSDWIDQELPHGRRLPRHQGIVRCNEALQPFVSEARAAVESQLERLRDGFATAQVLNSREFSFCFHDEDLCDLLLNLSRSNFS